MMHNQFKKNIKVIQLDSGGEYMSTEFSSFLYDKGIIHQKSYPHTLNRMEVLKEESTHTWNS